jgi:high-affinity Fe2+/Pb2+ permease
MIAAVPEMPSDDPGAAVVITGILAALVACFFVFWVLGGYRFFIGRVEDLENPWDLVRRSVPVGVAMIVAVGLFLGAVWLQDRERDAAWDRYDDQLNQQETTVGAP